MCGKSPWDLSSYRAKYLLKAPKTPGPSTHQCCLHRLVASSHFLSRYFNGISFFSFRTKPTEKLRKNSLDSAVKSDWVKIRHILSRSNKRRDPTQKWVKYIFPDSPIYITRQYGEKLCRRIVFLPQFREREKGRCSFSFSRKFRSLEQWIESESGKVGKSKSEGRKILARLIGINALPYRGLWLATKRIPGTIV